MEEVQKLVDDLEIDGRSIIAALKAKPFAEREQAAQKVLDFLDSGSAVAHFTQGGHNLRPTDERLRQLAKEAAPARYALAATCELELVATGDNNRDAGFGCMRRRAIKKMCEYALDANKSLGTLARFEQLQGVLLEQEMDVLQENFAKALEELMDVLRKSFEKHLNTCGLLACAEAVDVTKGMDAVPAHCVDGVAYVAQDKPSTPKANPKTPLEKAMASEGVDSADKFTLKNMRKSIDDGVIFSPTAKGNLKKIGDAYIDERGERMLFDVALVKLGIRLGEVVSRVGSWNIRASGFVPRKDESVLGSKANYVRAFAEKEHWDAFVLQEAPAKPCLTGAEALVTKLKEQLNAGDCAPKWKFVTACTHVDVGDQRAGDGCVFGFRTARWQLVGKPVRMPQATGDAAAFRRAPVAVLLRDPRVGQEGEVLAVVSVHLTACKRDGSRGPDGLDVTRSELKALGREDSLVAWLRKLRADRSPNARTFSCLLLGDFNLGRPGTHDLPTRDVVTDPKDAWKALVSRGFRFGQDESAPGNTNMPEFAEAGHSYDNALLLARLPPAEGESSAGGRAASSWLAEHPRCATVPLPPDLLRIAEQRGAACAALTPVAPDEHMATCERECAKAFVKAMKEMREAVRKSVYAYFSDHKPLTVTLLHGRTKIAIARVLTVKVKITVIDTVIVTITAT